MDLKQTASFLCLYVCMESEGACVNLFLCRNTAPLEKISTQRNVHKTWKENPMPTVQYSAAQQYFAVLMNDSSRVVFSVEQDCVRRVFNRINDVITRPLLLFPEPWINFINVLFS